MMEHEFINNKLLPIIRAAFDLNSEVPMLSGTDYERLQKFGKVQSVLPVIFQGLKKTHQPDEAINQFEEPVFGDIRNFIIRNKAYSDICAVLENINVDYIPLKGSVIKDLYPEPWMRTSCDIDILVHEEDLDQAITGIASRTDFIAGKRDYHDVSMENQRVHLEIHFSIMENMENIDRLLKKAWMYTVRTDSAHCYAFTPEFQIFHALAHMIFHLKKGGLGMRPFLDLWLMRGKMNYNEDVLREMCEQCGILVFYEKSCELLDAWMNGSEYTPEAKALEEYCLMGGVFGKKTFAGAAVLREGTGLSYLLRRLFIKRSALQEVYPTLKKYPVLLPYYQVKRWLSLTDIKKRKKIVRELNHIHKTSSEQIDSFSQLLESLGL